MTTEFWGAVTALLLVLIQVLRLTWSQRKIKTNDLGCIANMKKSIGRIEGTLTEFGVDIKRIDKTIQTHLNDHITGQIKGG